MIEPNAHYELYESRGREPDQDEHDWLCAEQKEQEWLRTEQEITTQQRQSEIGSATYRWGGTESAGGIPMNCLKCKNLEEAFESRLSQYIDACIAAYYRVTTELAAKKNVDMERAKNDLEEHQLVC
ncbi:MAG TPA: hypothetical protein VFV92_15590, partial [Candidatus Bathyarchaeia archaeon]|nr:hypothetical protein [Candidatus Bathyarchaeia archaeon]